MQSYVFKVTPELRALAQHAIDNHKWQVECYTGPAWGSEYEKPKEPSLLLVKDQGVYLISPFVLPGAPKDARLCGHDDKLVVIYAEGHDPRKDDDWWVAGDDYGQNVEVAKLLLDLSVAKIRIDVTSRTISVRASRYSAKMISGRN